MVHRSRGRDDARSGGSPPAGTITEYPLPTAGQWPQDIAAGPDGNLWFTELRRDRIGRITPAGTITEYPLPTADSYPGGIAAGPDGNLWFTEGEGNQIGRITPRGRITEYPLPTADSGPSGIAAGPDGNLWFTESSGNKIGRITPRGRITEYPLPTHRRVTPTAATPPGLRPARTATSGSPRRSRTGSGGSPPPASSPNTTPRPAISHPAGIVAGPDGNVWFTEKLGNQIGRITPPLTQTATVTTPKKIKYLGKTVLLKKAVKTNAGQPATSKVTVLPKGKKYSKVKTTPKGKVTITTLGKKKLKVTLTLTAPATSQYATYSHTKKWTVKQ